MHLTFFFFYQFECLGIIPTPALTVTSTPTLSHLYPHIPLQLCLHNTHSYSYTLFKLRPCHTLVATSANYLNTKLVDVSICGLDANSCFYFLSWECDVLAHLCLLRCWRRVLRVAWFRQSSWWIHLFMESGVSRKKMSVGDVSRPASPILMSGSVTSVERPYGFRADVRQRYQCGASVRLRY